MRSQYIIIFTTFVTLIVSMLFLSYTEKMQRERNENFWSIYFVYPLSEKNDFVIDNRTDSASFNYEIRSIDTVIASENVKIEKNEQKLININKNITPITITVTHDDTEKIIEKK